MKRYTLRVRLLDDSVTVDRLRAAVDDNLIRLHPRTIYHLGRVFSAESQSMMVEIVADGSKDMIGEHLKKLEGDLPIAIEGLDWGWFRDEDRAPGNVQNLRQDPLLRIEPEVGQVQFEISKKTLVIRYVFMLAFTITLFTLLIVRMIYNRTLALELSYAFVFLIWLITIREIPLDIRRYAKKIECGQSQLEVNYWIRNKIVALNWQAIWGVEYTYNECKIIGEEKTVRFLLNTGLAHREKEIMLKTLIERSSLNFVEMNFLKTVYRRYDAPNGV